MPFGPLVHFTVLSAVLIDSSAFGLVTETSLVYHAWAIWTIRPHFTLHYVESETIRGEEA